MIGLDANVLLRWLVDDGESQEQAALAAAAIAQDHEFHVSIIALVETIWVLREHYERPTGEIAEIVRSMLGVPNLTVQGRKEAEIALADLAAHGGDLPDHLLAAHDQAAGCSVTLTFDKKAARSAKYKRLTSEKPMRR